MSTEKPHLRIVTIVGARPQFIKAAMVSREICRRVDAGMCPAVEELTVHTGQHFDENMSAVFFDQLGIPEPAYHLGIGGGSHGQMTGQMIAAIERILMDVRPDWVLVYGDTNSTIAGALAAVKLLIPVAHVEAGLRSFNRRMPEEINRVLTDHAASLLFAPTEAAVANLRREGVDERKIALVGDVMFEAMLFYRELASSTSTVLQDIGVEPGQFILATVHRAENTDDRERLAGIIEGLSRLATLAPVVLPLHPRTAKMLREHDLQSRADHGLMLIDPVGYLDMVRLESGAALIATDSGGVQKEAFFNRVPCLTLRDETEWVELIEAGANRLVSADPDVIEQAGRQMIRRTVPQVNLYGEGHVAAAILDRLSDEQTAAARATASATTT